MFSQYFLQNLRKIQVERYLWNLLNLLPKAERISRLDQVEFSKYPENNFHILSGQLIAVLTHLYTEVLNTFSHISNQNLPCCNFWCSPLALSYTSAFYLNTHWGSCRPQKDPPQALLFFTVDKTSLVRVLSLWVTHSGNLTIVVMLLHTHSLTMMSLLHWGPKTGHETVPVCSSWILFKFLSTRTSKVSFSQSCCIQHGENGARECQNYVIIGFLQFDDQIKKIK